MKTYRRIYVPMSLDEFEALRQQAQRDTRPPRDQARHILRTALLGNAPVSEMQNRLDATTDQGQSIETVT